jgi:hypothetical protein
VTSGATRAPGGRALIDPLETIDPSIDPAIDLTIDPTRDRRGPIQKMSQLARRAPPRSRSRSDAAAVPRPVARDDGPRLDVRPRRRRFA